MLIISKEQEEALYQGFFETWMIEHLNEFFPQQCAKLKKRGVREEIRYGIKKAAAYGIDEGPELCRFIDLMMLFGCEFDTNPKYPWAAEILNDKEIHDSVSRMKLLRTEAEKYF